MTREIRGTLVFDMDGTIANLYGVETWLDDLRNENIRPYVECEPLVDIDTLNLICDLFRAIGFKIIITTWLSKNSSIEYKKAVRMAKLEWLNKVGFEYDEIHLVQYGTTKANCTRKYNVPQILIDDNETIRNGWNLGNTVNANENIIENLLEIFEKMVDR